MNEAIIKTASPELQWLTYTVLMTGLLWVPYIINRIVEMGVFNAFWNPDPDTAAKAAWARRMKSAHENAVENLIIFVPAVLIVEYLGINSTTTAFACMIYFYARAAHYVVYTMGIPLLRPFLFLVGVWAQLVLLIQIVKVFS